MTHYTYNKQESGRSMIEMVGVLAIAGLLTAGAFVLIQSGLASQKRNRAADEINTLVANARALSAESSTFGNLPQGTTAPANNTAQGAKLAQGLLKSDGKTPFGDDSFYAITANGATLYIWLVGFDSEEDCTTMGIRSYSGGTAACNGTTLSIQYGKQ